MAASSHLLSKSTFMYGCQCPKRLYLHKFADELRNPLDEKQQAIFSSGSNVGLLAQQLFPGGIDASPPDHFSYAVSIEKTNALIHGGEKKIYEAAFVHEGVLCALDILLKKGKHWKAFEVKGTLRVKEPHILDASLQYFVMKNAGLQAKDISILHLNKEYVRIGDLELENLFTSQSILEEVLGKQEFVESKVKELIQVLKKKEIPAILPGDHCWKPYDCDFSNYCWKEINEEFYPDEEYYKIDSIHNFTDSLSFPLYFLDFETIMPGIPEFNHSRPFQQIPFQFSLHVQKEQNSEPQHFSFLGDGLNDPRPELIANMLRHIGETGTILAWNQPFEIARLKELARDFPEHQIELMQLLPRFKDLMTPFRKKFITRPEFQGSYSLKKVLNSMVPELNYNSLSIQDGGTASLVYSNLKNHDSKTREKQRKQLLEYCHLDTLALVRILEKLMHM